LTRTLALESSLVDLLPMKARLTAPLLALALLGCRTTPPEPATPPAPVDAGPHVPAVHVIVEKDHRSLTKISVGDVIELPHDPDFAWTIKFENGSYFEPAPASEAGVERYEARRTGIVRTLVAGAPKICMHSDAPCTLAEYAWQVTLAVE
jgi:hypothetical protein